MFFSRLLKKDKEHKPKLMALDFFKYIGPGMLVTIVSGLNIMLLLSAIV